MGTGSHQGRAWGADGNAGTESGFGYCGTCFRATFGIPYSNRVDEVWLKGKQQTRASSTYERYHQIVEQFIEFLGNRASLGVAHITPSDIMDYRGSLERKGLSPKTCNLTVKIIGAALNAAKRQGLITYNPVEALDPLPHEAITKKPFTHEQVSELLQKATGDWRGAILAGYYTGQRLRDVANIRWSAIDLTQKQLSLMPQKTKRSKKWEQ